MAVAARRNTRQRPLNFPISLLSSSLRTLFPLTCCWQITLFIHKIKHWEKSTALGMGWALLELFWPFQIKPAHLSFPPAQHNTPCLTSVHAGVGSAQSSIFWAVQLNLGSQRLSGAQTLSNSNTETYSVCGNHKAQDGPQKVTQGQTSGSNSSVSARKGTQHTDLWEPQFPHHYLELFASWDVLEKDSVNLEVWFRSLSRGWSLMGNYHTLFL